MTTEDIFRNELLARKARLQEQIKDLTAQLNMSANRRCGALNEIIFDFGKCLRCLR